MKENEENIMPENDRANQHVEEDEIIIIPWYNFVILTWKRKKNNVFEITGFSTNKLVSGEIIYNCSLKNSQRLQIIKELMRRDAKGEWENDDNKNLWFKATAKPIVEPNNFIKPLIYRH